jgi:GT2 family glycosyltransferase
MPNIEPSAPSEETKDAEEQRPRVELFIATPCYGGQVTTAYMLSMLASVQILAENNVNVHINTLTTESLITRARNVQLAIFLSESKYTHFLFIDADVGFTAEAILDLLDADYPVSACPYPHKDYDFKKVKQAMSKNADISPEDLRKAGINYVLNLPISNKRQQEISVHKKHFIEVHDTGTGFFLMRRDAVIRMSTAYPELRHTNANEFYAQFNDTAVALFDTMIDPDTKAYYSEDFAFCYRWRRMGGHIYLSLKHSLSHTGNHTFAGDIIKSITRT